MFTSAPDRRLRQIPGCAELIPDRVRRLDRALAMAGTYCKTFSAENISHNRLLLRTARG